MPSLSAKADHQALAQIEEAFTRFQNIVNHDDTRNFKSSQLQDVRTAALEIQKRLAAKRSSRYLRRLQPLLDGIAHYSRAVEVLCNGTPYLPWIWAPITLFLQLASDKISAFERLLSAYADIAEALPRFDILAKALEDHPDFHKVLAAVYVDILEFHRQAYKVFRQNAWQRFFDTSWARFDHRFNGILQNLRRHAELVDKEANAFNILRLQDLRDRSIQETEEREKDRLNQQFQNVLTWLEVRDYDQEDLVEDLSLRCHEGSVDWFFANKQYLEWMAGSTVKKLLWVQGIPGSGKSVLCSRLIAALRQSSSPVIYYVHDYKTPAKGQIGRILRSLVCQMVRHSLKLAAFIHKEFIDKGYEASKKRLTELLIDLVSGSPDTKIIFDGLDECASGDVKELLALITHSKNSSLSTHCRVVVFSRNEDTIQKATKKWPAIALTKEKPAIEAAIRLWVHARLESLQADHDMVVAPVELKKVEEIITQKANGMFLWVRLMLTTFNEAHTYHELEEAVHSLPPGLDEAYGRMLDAIDLEWSTTTSTKARNLMAWIAYAERPLRLQELLAGSTLGASPYALNDRTRQPESVLDVIRPLIDINNRGVVSFVHFTVKEYILHNTSTSQGPFLDAAPSHQHLAQACASHLLASLDLIDTRLIEEEAAHQVAKGFHALHAYVFAYWPKHFESLETLASQPHLHDVRLICRAVASRHTGLIHRDSDSVSRSPSPPILTGGPTEGLRLFDRMKTEAYQSAEVFPDIGQSTDDDDSGHNAGYVQDDPTLFPLVRAKYAEIVRILMSDEAPTKYPHLQKQVLERFRRDHTVDIYTCRYPTCHRQYDGFDNAKALEIHERSHKAQIMCTEPSCFYHDGIGFRSVHELNKHNKAFHRRDDFLEKPPAFSRRSDDRPEDPSTAEPEPQSQNDKRNHSLSKIERHVPHLEQNRSKRALIDAMQHAEFERALGKGKEQQADIAGPNASTAVQDDTGPLDWESFLHLDMTLDADFRRTF